MTYNNLPTELKFLINDYINGNPKSNYNKVMFHINWTNFHFRNYNVPFAPRDNHKHFNTFIFDYKTLIKGEVKNDFYKQWNYDFLQESEFENRLSEFGYSLRHNGVISLHDIWIEESDDEEVEEEEDC